MQVANILIALHVFVFKYVQKFIHSTSLDFPVLLFIFPMFDFRTEADRGC